MADLKDILYDNGEPISEEDLLKYLNKNTSSEEKQAIENLSGDFENDALQGLKQVKNSDDLQKQVKLLKHNLQQQLNKKNKKKDKRKIAGMNWMIVAIILLLLICVLGFVLIKMIS